MIKKLKSLLAFTRTVTEKLTAIESLLQRLPKNIWNAAPVGLSAEHTLTEEELSRIRLDFEKSIDDMLQEFQE